MPFVSPAKKYGAVFSLRKNASSYVKTTDPTPVTVDGVATMFNDVPTFARVIVEPFVRGPMSKSVAAL